MEVDRRGMVGAALAAVAGLAAACRRGDGPDRPPPQPARLGGEPEWEDVRRQFALSDDYIHMSALLIASHPTPVREAIERHRRELDANPVVYLNSNNSRLESAAQAAAARYMGAEPRNVALTESTTMGVGLMYNGLQLRPGQELLSTEQDYYVTHEALRLASRRTGAQVREIPLYADAQTVSEDEIVGRLLRAVGPATRVMALTWVHSSSGLKLPLRRIADGLEEINRGRDEADHVLLCVDGVHGFGNQDGDIAGLGCDFFAAGAHKWLFGPRGTGVLLGSPKGWRSVVATIPSFMDDGTWHAWLTDGEPGGRTTGARMTPGGFKAFEHKWALTQAFEFQEEIGKARVAARTAELAGQLKEGLAGIGGVTLHTPRAEALSAGIVSFDVDGVAPDAAVRRLRERRVIASVAPYATPHVRLTPSIRNTPAEVDAALREVRALA